MQIVSDKFLSSLREWAAIGEDLLLSVFIDDYAIGLFKDDIDGCSTDEELREMLRERYQLRIIK